VTDAPPVVVLVVDDEEPVRRLARRILESAGYEVLDSSRSLDAISILSDGATVVDLLVADLEMPELAGEEMARRIRIIHPDLRVLYVTGYIDRLLDARPMLWEGEAYLDKPFSSSGLLEAVSLLLTGKLGSG
jgi:CheY-like chemotaxis protein